MHPEADETIERVGVHFASDQAQDADPRTPLAYLGDDHRLGQLAQQATLDAVGKALQLLAIDTGVKRFVGVWAFGEAAALKPWVGVTLFHDFLLSGRTAEVRPNALIDTPWKSGVSY